MDSIANFLELEVNEKLLKINDKIVKDEYSLDFIKKYDELKYFTVDDIINNPTNKEEEKYFKNKKILLLTKVVEDVNFNINKIVQFSNIVDKCVKQVMGPEI